MSVFNLLSFLADTWINYVGVISILVNATLFLVLCALFLFSFLSVFVFVCVKGVGGLVFGT